MKTQCQMIREHLEAGNRLSPIEALDKFGCFRLASRINELRKQGMDIRTDIVEGAENGKRWAEYWLHRDSGLLEAPEPTRPTLTHFPDKDDAMALAMFATKVAKVAKATVDKEPQAKPRRRRRKGDIRLDSQPLHKADEAHAIPPGPLRPRAPDSVLAICGGPNMTHWLVVYKDMSKFEPPKYSLFRTELKAVRFARTLNGKQWQIKALEEEDTVPTPAPRKPRRPNGG